MATPRLLRRAFALAVLTLLAAVTGCGGDNSGGAGAATTPPVAAGTAGAATTAPATTAAIDLTKVTLRVGDQVKLAQTGLEAAGQADTPYKIEWASFTSGPPLLEALNADAIDIGGVGDAPPIFAASSGAKIKSVLATKTPQVNQGILVKGNAITSVTGLKGKKIAVAKGSSANWVLLKALQENGLTIGDVEIAYLQPTDAQQAFANGSVDAWAIWAPFSLQAQAQGATFVVTGDQLGIPGLTFQVASDKALADPAKSAAIADFLARYRAAQVWQRTNKDAWAQKYSELTKLPVDLARGVLGVDPVFTAIDGAVVSAQQAEADGFFAAGLIPTKVDAAAIVDDRFNAVTLPESGA
jgi:sulfonate transport system substrate-binding protein